MDARTSPSDETDRGGPPRRPIGDSQAQRQRYLDGHRPNPLTTTLLGGRILSGSQLLWFLLWPPRGFGVLTTIGRRTGRKRRKCVRAIRRGSKVYLISLRGPHAAWMHNLRAHPQVRVRLRAGRFDGTARVVTDREELKEAESVLCDTVHRFDALEYRMHRTGSPNDEAIRAMHTHWFTVGTPLVVDLRDPRPAWRPRMTTLWRANR